MRNKDKDSLFHSGMSFEKNKSIEERKDKGVFYTPLFIVDQMVSDVLKDIDLIKNPYLKILDPACGAGYFLITMVEKLTEKFTGCVEDIIRHNAELQGVLTIPGLKRFIIENNIYGADVDEEAVALTVQSLKSLAGEDCHTNIYCCDSLIDGKLLDMAPQGLWNHLYDIIIGNPPYIGHKGIDSSYKSILQQLYHEVYKDKSDIQYCFIKRAIDSLKDEGVMSFICSRYFLEGPSAGALRQYIIENCSVREIIDFEGVAVFEEAGVATCILILKKTESREDTLIKKPKASMKKKGPSIFEESLKSYTVSKEMLLKEGWLLLPQEEYSIFRKLEQQASRRLGDLFYSYQGIITGCDKAFIVNAQTIEQYQLEEELLRPWIKNKHVQRNEILDSDLYIIYSDFIKQESEYPKAINFIRQQYDKLIERRECKKGIRSWYELQWGRKPQVFDSKKIVYPYKSAVNRFAVDHKGNYCSADVYSLILKEEYADSLSYELAAAILNSRVIEFYFQCYAKKLGDNLYDYYPNTVLRLGLPQLAGHERLNTLSSQLSFCKNEVQKSCMMAEVDGELYKIYQLTDREIEILENKHK